MTNCAGSSTGSVTHHELVVKLQLAALSLALILVGCGRQGDGDIRRVLAGGWIVSGNRRDGTSFTNTITVAPNGRYVCYIVTRAEAGTNQIADVEGTLQVQGGVLIDTMTKHSNTNAILPLSARARVVRFDEDEIVLKWELNQEMDTPTNEVVFRRSAK